jgi:hypothetical protein
VKIRPFEKDDIPSLKECHRKAGYGFDLPDFETLKACYTVEDEGRIVGFAGAEICAEIIAIFDPEWSTPQERMRTFAAMHPPISKELWEDGIRYVHLLVDGKFRAFGRRLQELGWKAITWKMYGLSLADVVKGKHLV